MGIGMDNFALARGRVQHALDCLKPTEETKATSALECLPARETGRHEAKDWLQARGHGLAAARVPQRFSALACQQYQVMDLECTIIMNSSYAS